MAAIAMAGYIVLNAAGTRQVATAIGRVNLDPSRYLTVVAQFVDEHKHEAGWSFAVSTRPTRVDPEVLLREGYPDDNRAPVHTRRLSDILFARYYDEMNPKYIIRGR
jgi:hypothetical protein